MISALIQLSLGPFEQSVLDATMEMAIPQLIQECSMDFHRLPADDAQASGNSSKSDFSSNATGDGSSFGADGLQEPV
jgi:hypothetical protein